ncbi:MAG: amino acid adenylation domain-containing protein, partial [Chthoniobacterales bacterium]
WLVSFEELIESVLISGDVPLDTLPLLSKLEKRDLEVWNATTQDYPKERSVPAIITDIARAHPEKTAVQCGDTSISYAELDLRANRLAAHLNTLGVKSGDLVGLFIERSAEMVIGLLGILKSGAAYVPMDPTFPKERLRFMVEDAHLRAIVTQSSLIDLLPAHDTKVVALDSPLPETPAAFLAKDAACEEPACVIFTSGSTGRPKGVVTPHRALVNFLTSMQREPGINKDDILFSVTTLSFDISGLEIFLPLITGGTIIIAKKEILADGNLLRSELERTSATFMQATPATWRLLLEAGWIGNRHLKILVGGEAVPRELVNHLLPCCASLWNVYGPTETTIWSATTKLEEQSGSIPIGRPIANTQIYVVNPSLQLQPIGIPGELLIGGDGLALGYLDRPELTAERFIPDPFRSKPGARLYRTGDIGCWRADGLLECHGRLDHQIKLRGYRIETGEIESALEEHSDVAQAIVDLREGKLVGYVRLEKGVITEDTAIWKDQWDNLFLTAIKEAGSEKLDQVDSVITSWAGLENAEAQVNEWIETTIARIRNYHPCKVLEIGCGTGQLLTRLAPQAEAYWAADISQVAIEALGKAITLPQVKLLHRAADDFTDIPDSYFDTIILNSVLQYFPNAEYLMHVLIDAARALAPSGKIFLGDIQGNALLHVSYAETLAQRASHQINSGQLREKINQRVSIETELSLDPAWFELLDLPGLTNVEIQLRRGKLSNEATNYHYDVILHFDKAAKLLPITTWSNWSRLEKLQTQFAENPSYLAIREIPDARVASPNAFYNTLINADADAPLPSFPSIPSNAITAEELYVLAEKFGYLPYVQWSNDGTDGLINAIFISKENPALPIWKKQYLRPSVPLTNTPYNDQTDLTLKNVFNSLRRDLSQKLPDYMIPAIFIKMDAFALTPNGKVNRRLLPLPNFDTIVNPAAAAFVAPVSNTEKILADIWQQVLSLKCVGIHDDIFELGGDSILIFQITARANRAGLKLSPAQIFQHRTIAALARQTTEEKSTDGPTIKRLDREAYRRK